MSFDIRLFGGLLAQGSGLFGAGVAALGLPSCILNLSADLLALLPGSVLLTIQRMIGEYKAKIQERITEGFNYLAEKFGIEQYITELGTISLRADSSILNLDSSLVAGIAQLAALADVAGDIYANVQNAGAALSRIKDCLNQIKDAMDSTDNPTFQNSAERNLYRDTNYARQVKSIEEAVALREKVQSLEDAINEELLQRVLDPEREPKINPKYSDLFPNTSFEIADAEDDQEELIRLVYGPPRSREGQFVLSLDGLYYDSQTDDGLIPVLVELRDRQQMLKASEKWKFDFDPNLGGKGEQISSRNFNKWIDSIFDINIIDDSELIHSHYQKDGFLQTLIGQRDKRVIDISKQITELEEAGESEAIITNLKQSLVSESAQHETKINKRKKQIEIAVKAPNIFGGATVFDAGKVPVNDFSYLQGFNISLALADQKQLVINPEDVSGIVMPIEPKFVKVSSKNPSMTIEELYIPSMGFDAIISDTNDVLEARPPTINMDEVVSTDGLFAMYNFLNSNVVLPSSLEFKMNNSVTTDDYNNAQLVAKTSQEVYDNFGLAAPLFKGITVNSGNNPSALGSYLKLPDTREFQDWTYRKTGFSLDTWTYMPDIDQTLGWKDNSSSSLYRLILANENTGITNNRTREDDYNFIPYTESTDYVKGMIVGFTIDRRWTRGLNPSNNFVDQDPSNGYGLVIAPTISYDATSVGFMTKPGCLEEDKWLGMYIPHTKTTASGKSLETLRTEYCLLTMAVSYEDDTLNVYLDGELLESSAVSNVFGSDRGRTIKIPSFKKENSFEYSADTVGNLAPKSIKNGPKTYPFFTPWIIGGGYTDGNALNGNFMGGEFGGQRSGLNGYLGSVKFYSKSVSEDAAKQNYKVQSVLFKQLYKKPTIELFLAVGQSNMDGEFTTIDAQADFTRAILFNTGLVEPEFLLPQDSVKIWMPSAVDASGGDWKSFDIMNIAIWNQIPMTPPELVDPTFGGYNSTRYDITSPEGANRYDPNLTTSVRHYDMISDFARLVNNYKRSDAVYFVKNAINGASMVSGLPEENAPLSWTDSNPVTNVAANVQGSGLMFTFLNDTSAAIEKLSQIKPEDADINVTLLLLQGEAESVYVPALDDVSNAGNIYYENPDGRAKQWAYYFSSVFYPTIQSSVKAALGKPNMPDFPFLVGHLPTKMQKQPVPESFQRGVTDSGAYFIGIVRDQQKLVANDPTLNVHLVDLEGDDITSYPPSNIHYSVGGLKVVGSRFFDKFKQIQQN